MPKNIELKNIELKNIELKKLEKKYNNCQKCKELVCNRNNVVFGVGNVNTSSVIIIGEAPGKQEDLKKEPFVGRSGKILDELLEEIGLNRKKDIYITNTILCKPPKNRNPTKEELKNCKERLDQHIEILKPKAIVTLGNFATKYILQTKEGITKLRGNVFEKEIKGITVKIIPMLHPAVLLYNGNSPQKRKEFQNDFQILQKTVGTKREIINFSTQENQS